MQRKWFYADAGESIGPLSTAEIYQRIFAARRQTHFVWTEGMPDWVDARKLPEFEHAFADRAFVAPSVAADAPEKKATLAQRARHELVTYLCLSAYLWICFGALIVYKAAILRSVGVAYTPLGVAIVKALILAKFIMLLEAVKLGDRGKLSAPIFDVMKKSGLFAVFLFILTILEELLLGYAHGKEVRDILRDFAGGTLQEAFAVGLLLFLIMIPYFAYREFKPDLMRSKLDASGAGAVETAQ
jgi:hypothetical protein